MQKMIQNPEQKSDVAKSSVRDGASMFVQSEPKARQGRPHEFQAPAKSQGPQPTLINICPNLVVPEKVPGFWDSGILGCLRTCSDMGSYEFSHVEAETHWFKKRTRMFRPASNQSHEDGKWERARTLRWSAPSWFPRFHL